MLKCKIMACFVFNSSSELLRVIDSLQLTATKKVATPADWEVCMVEQLLLGTLIKSIHSQKKLEPDNPCVCVQIQERFLNMRSERNRCLILIYLPIVLFTVNFSHLHYNVIQRGCEAISS